MKRASWMKLTGVCLMAVAMTAGVAWADPTGAANVPQILNGVTLKGEGGSEQRTFLTTDLITFEATYYDPEAGCAGVEPFFVRWFLFNLEGQLIAGDAPADSDPFAPESKYRLLFLDLPSNSLAPDSYKFAFLVRSCDDAISVVLPEFLTIRVFAP